MPGDPYHILPFMRRRRPRRVVDARTGKMWVEHWGECVCGNWTWLRPFGPKWLCGNCLAAVTAGKTLDDFLQSTLDGDSFEVA